MDDGIENYSLWKLFKAMISIEFLAVINNLLYPFSDSE